MSDDKRIFIAFALARLNRYMEFTIVEMVVPLVFAALYLLVLFS